MNLQRMDLVLTIHAKEVTISVELQDRAFTTERFTYPDINDPSKVWGYGTMYRRVERFDICKVSCPDLDTLGKVKQVTHALTPLEKKGSSTPDAFYCSGPFSEIFEKIDEQLEIV